MLLHSPGAIKELLSKYSARPEKRLGQNFLIDKNILDKIIQAADIKNTDTIVEVGPGLGALTGALAEKAGKVIAVEKDKTMVQILAETANLPNVEVIQQDILKYSPPADSYKVIANIPYYLTSPLIRTFLESKNPPTQLLLMIQKEVAERICAKPGDMSLLAVSVQYYATPAIVQIVSKNSFWPAPKIDSAVISIVPHKPDRIASPRVTGEQFFQVVRAGFSQPRKQLANNLATSLKQNRADVETWLQKNNISPSARAETLSVNDWINLTHSYRA